MNIIKNVYLDGVILNSKNINSIKQSIALRVERYLDYSEVVFYQSVFFNALPADYYNCEFQLFLLKNNIHLNLKTDSQMLRFIDNCDQYVNK